MATNSRRKTTPTPEPATRDRRFYELLDLASEQNEQAVQDLWLEYRYDFKRTGKDVCHDAD